MLNEALLNHQKKESVNCGLRNDFWIPEASNYTFSWLTWYFDLWIVRTSQKKLLEKLTSKSHLLFLIKPHFMLQQ